jgi:hypothetical protein
MVGSSPTYAPKHILERKHHMARELPIRFIMDEFILTDSNDVVPLKRHCQIQPYRKGWLSDFWFI